MNAMLKILVVAVFLVHCACFAFADESESCALAVYDSRLYPAAWTINGKKVENKKAVEALKATKAKYIYFRADFLLTDKNIKAIRGVFSDAHVVVKEFWVQGAFAPGWFDLAKTFER